MPSSGLGVRGVVRAARWFTQVGIDTIRSSVEHTVRRDRVAGLADLCNHSRQFCASMVAQASRTSAPFTVFDKNETQLSPDFDIRTECWQYSTRLSNQTFPALYSSPPTFRLVCPQHSQKSGENSVAFSRGWMQEGMLIGAVLWWTRWPNRQPELRSSFARRGRRSLEGNFRSGNAT